MVDKGSRRSRRDIDVASIHVLDPACETEPRDDSDVQLITHSDLPVLKPWTPPVNAGTGATAVLTYIGCGSMASYTGAAPMSASYVGLLTLALTLVAGPT